MHALIIGAGLFLVFIIVIHLIFRVIKFTFAAFFLGLALVGVLYVFHKYLGIDLIGEIARHT